MGWQDRAACRGLGPSLFYPETTLDRGQELLPAKAVCASCPVWEPCLQEGFGERHGIWGGLTVAQRNRLRYRARKKAVA